MYRVVTLTVATLAAALTMAASAAAGGWATVQLSSHPGDTPAGGTWRPELTVLQHGRTPLDGVVPLIRIRQDGVLREATALPAGRPGVYRAELRFPTSGTWRLEIWDGFSQTHGYPPVTIAPAGGGDGGVPVAPVAAGLGILAAALAGALFLLRRRSAPTASAA